MRQRKQKTEIFLSKKHSNFVDYLEQQNNYKQMSKQSKINNKVEREREREENKNL